MKVIDASSVFASLASWVAAAIVLAVAATYFLRRRVRERYPGGRTRYLAALFVQAGGFMIPIPVALIVMFGMPVPAGLDVVIAIALGVLVVWGLRQLPLTGPLLKDLHRARLEVALERQPPFAGGRS